MKYRNTYLQVDTKSVLHNFNFYKDNVKKHIFAVVKANAYGLGMIEMAKLFEKESVEMLCVATIDEAFELRENGIENPILVMGYTPTEALACAAESNITLTVTSKDHAQSILNSNVSNLKLHIKINTSMNRLGFNSADEIKCVFDDLNINNTIEGIFTHYAINTHSGINNDFNYFKDIVDKLHYNFKYIHCASSSSSLNYQENYTNAARIGIGLYDNSISDNLKQCVALYTQVAQINKIKPEQSVGYDGNYMANESEYIATLPIGYADGILRCDTGNYVFINNAKYQIVGNICMDQLMVMVDSTVNVKDQVELFGPHISLSDYAKTRNTINYEVIAIISNRVVRKYI